MGNDKNQTDIVAKYQSSTNEYVKKTIEVVKFHNEFVREIMPYFELLKKNRGLFNLKLKKQQEDAKQSVEKIFKSYVNKVDKFDFENFKNNIGYARYDVFLMIKKLPEIEKKISEIKKHENELKEFISKIENDPEFAVFNQIEDKLNFLRNNDKNYVKTEEKYIEKKENPAYWVEKEEKVVKYVTGHKTGRKVRVKKAGKNIIYTNNPNKKTYKVKVETTRTVKVPTSDSDIPQYFEVEKTRVVKVLKPEIKDEVNKLKSQMRRIKNVTNFYTYYMNLRELNDLMKNRMDLTFEANYTKKNLPIFNKYHDIEKKYLDEYTTLLADIEIFRKHCKDGLKENDILSEIESNAFNKGVDIYGLNQWQTMSKEVKGWLEDDKKLNSIKDSISKEMK